MPDELPPVPNAPQDSADRILAVLCHLSVFYCPFIVPLVVFLVKRNSGFVAEHAKEALNFHLTLLFFGVLCIIPAIFCLGGPFYAALGVFGIVCGIIAAIRAWDGGFYRYPITFRLV